MKNAGIPILVCCFIMVTMQGALCNASPLDGSAALVDSTLVGWEFSRGTDIPMPDKAEITGMLGRFLDRTDAQTDSLTRDIILNDLEVSLDRVRYAKVVQGDSTVIICADDLNGVSLGEYAVMAPDSIICSLDRSLGSLLGSFRRPVGYILVTSHHPELPIRVDNKYRGITNQKFCVSCEEHTIVVQLPDSTEARGTVTVTNGVTIIVPID